MRKTHFSSLMIEYLMKQTDDMNKETSGPKLSYVKFVGWNETRWNSMLMMMRSVIPCIHLVGCFFGALILPYFFIFGALVSALGTNSHFYVMSTCFDECENVFHKFQFHFLFLSMASFQYLHSNLQGINVFSRTYKNLFFNKKLVGKTSM